MDFFTNKQFLFYAIIVVIIVMVILLSWLFFMNRKDNKNPKKLKPDYEYFGYDRTIHSKRKYILLTIIDSDKTEFKKMKLASIIFSATVNLQKALKSNKKATSKLIDIIDSKVIIDKYPTYLLLEVTPSDLSQFESHPELTNEYVNSLKNLVYYTTKIDEIRTFMEDR